MAGTPSLSADPLGLGTKSVQLVAATLIVNNEPAVAYVEITYGSGEVVVSGWPRRPTIPGPGPQPPHYFSDGVVTIIPEPAMMLLFGLGVLLLKARRFFPFTLSCRRWK